VQDNGTLMKSVKVFSALCYFAERFLSPIRYDTFFGYLIGASETLYS
jgi:hypothetical protein